MVVAFSLWKVIFVKRQLPGKKYLKIKTQLPIKPNKIVKTRVVKLCICMFVCYHIVKQYLH